MDPVSQAKAAEGSSTSTNVSSGGKTSAITAQPAKNGSGTEMQFVSSILQKERKEILAIGREQAMAARAANNGRQPPPKTEEEKAYCQWEHERILAHREAQRAAAASLSPEEIALVQQQEADRKQRLKEMKEKAEKEDAEREKKLELKYGAEQVLVLISPVSVCMLIVIATIKSVSYFSKTDQQFAYTPYKETDSNESNGEKLGGALLNTLIIIGIVVFMTFGLVALYKYRCMKVIHGWLIISSLLLLFYFSYVYLTEVLQANNSTLDYFTLAMIIWNFGSVGMVVIHWKGPLIVQQIFLIITSALMALVFIKNLPEWTTWILLGGIAVYDLVAVLCPYGPLRMLVEEAQTRDEPLFPALIYSTTMAWIIPMADVDRSQNSEVLEDDTEIEETRSTTPLTPTTPADSRLDAALTPAEIAAREEEEEASGVKLGLGDFIFYSILVGKAATQNDYGTLFACYVAILIGLACTLLLLAIHQKALPALPISIMFGLVFYFSTSRLLSPFLGELGARQLFM